MSRLNELELEIRKLEKAIEPLYQEKERIFHEKQKLIQDRLDACLKGKYSFTREELRFAKTEECTCGAKLAYPIGIGMYGAWYCSDVLMDRNADQEHIDPIPFLESNIN